MVRIVSDWDGTMSPYDIGKHFLSGIIFYNDPANKFWETVKRIRSGKLDVGVPYNPRTDHGIELAMMAIYYGLDKNLIKKTTEEVARENHILKPCARKLVENTNVIISTAGIYGVLRTILGIYGINTPIIGTTLKYDDNGVATSIEQKNGLSGKVENLEKCVNGEAIIGIGDSRGDSELLKYASRNGVSISSGAGASEWANIIAHGDDFSGEAFAAIAAKGILDGKSDKEILNELKNFFGNAKINIEKGGNENEIARKVLQLYKSFR